MKAMLLCAGLGTRLRPITNEIPKPLLPVFGRPVVEYLIESLSEAGVGEIVVNAHHLPEKISAALGGRNQGVKITYSREPEILGPVGGIRKALPLLGEGPLLIVNGDVVMDFDFGALVRYHEERKAALTMAVGPGTDRPALRAVGVTSDGRVRQVWRKPEWKGGALEECVNLGAFVYDWRVIERYIPENSFYDFREQLIPSMFENDERIFAFRTECYWNDIGEAGSYLKAHLDAFSGGGTERIARRLSGTAVLGKNVTGPVYFGKKVCVAGDAMIGPNVSLEDECKVGAGARVSDSVVLPGAIVPNGSDIRHAVVLGDKVIECSQS
jgi:NDP-sugar pyrophosphorylase family protein